MRLLRRLLVGLPALAFAACSSSDSPVAPTPDGGEGSPVIQDFSVSDSDGVITHGDFTTLRWSAPGAAEIAILPVVGQGLNPQSGAVVVRPARATTWVITVRNALGTVSDSVHVDVRYRPGVYVKASGGDDSAAGTDIDHPVATLGEALRRTAAGGTIFLSAGTYTEPLAITGAHVSVYGGLDPATFFEGQPAENYPTTVRPSSGVPLSIRETPGIMEISRIRFDAINTGDLAGEVVDAEARLLGCTLDARHSTIADPNGGAALRVLSTGPGANVEARSCRIFGPRQSFADDARGISVEQAQAAAAADLLVANCFVDGGSGVTRSSGIYVDSSGSIGIGMSTIGAETSSAGLDLDTPAAIRVARGAPFIGGNILFTRGSGQRFGVQETSALGNPSSLESNLFISVGGTPYDNFDGPDPLTPEDLNQPVNTICPDQSCQNVGGNILESTYSISQIVVDVNAQDFHLKAVGVGVPNPAVDRGESWLFKAQYGAVSDDIDGDTRPSFGNLRDLGADEHN